MCIRDRPRGRHGPRTRPSPACSLRGRGHALPGQLLGEGEDLLRVQDQVVLFEEADDRAAMDLHLEVADGEGPEDDLAVDVLAVPRRLGALKGEGRNGVCLLYTSDAADDLTR